MTPEFVRAAEAAADIAEHATLSPEDRGRLLAAADRIWAALDPKPAPDTVAAQDRYARELATSLAAAGMAAAEVTATPLFSFLGRVAAMTVLARHHLPDRTDA